MPLSPLLALLIAAAAPQSMTAMDHAAPSCPATPASLPAGMQGWTGQHVVTAGANATRAPSLLLGSGAAATLLPTAQVTYAAAPAKPGGPATHGGLVAFTVPAAARYRIALGASAWIDVIAGTSAVPSASHGHGPECSGIRKMVDFDLKPGRYLLQLAGAEAATLRLMVARLP